MNVGSMREAGWPLDTAVMMRAFGRRLNVGPEHEQSVALLGELFEHFAALTKAIGYDGLAARIGMFGAKLTEGEAFLRMPKHEAVIEALCEVQISSIAFAHSCGWDIASAFEAVHVSKVRLVGPSGRVDFYEHGGPITPRGWVPPNMAPYVVPHKGKPIRFAA